MPSVCRRIAALLAVACLGVAAPVTPALAQGAGDEQYQDPFGNSGSGSGSGSSKPKTQTTQSGSEIAPLSPAPQTSGGASPGTSGTAGTTGSGTTTAAPSPAAGESLPNTGLDTRVLLLGGAVLLLIGVGLRLRSAPERF